MPPSWVGVLIALLPLSMLLVIFTGPLVEWHGPRRILTWGWLFRNLSAAMVITIPWAMRLWGKPGGWMVLLLSTLGFCIFRAISVGGWFPWLHEVVPPHQRGHYLATETALAQIVTIMVVVACGTILGRHGELSGFFLIYAVGIITGLTSIGLMRRIPGGEGSDSTITREPPRGILVQAFRNCAYMGFVKRTFFCLAVLSGQSSVAIMYLRDVLAYSDRHIMYLAAAGSLAVVLLIGRLINLACVRGSRIPIMTGIMLTHSIFALGWLGLLPAQAWTNGLAWAAVIGSTFCNAAFTTMATRDMLGQISETGRVGYTNLWIIATSLSSGLVPILTGLLIDWLGLSGFRLCFLASGLGGILAAASFHRNSH